MCKINASNGGLGPKKGEGENAFTVHNCENNTGNTNTISEDLAATDDGIKYEDFDIPVMNEYSD